MVVDHLELHLHRRAEDREHIRSRAFHEGIDVALVAEATVVVVQESHRVGRPGRCIHVDGQNGRAIHEQWRGLNGARDDRADQGEPPSGRRDDRRERQQQKQHLCCEIRQEVERVRLSGEEPERGDRQRAPGKRPRQSTDPAPASPPRRCRVHGCRAWLEVGSVHRGAHSAVAHLAVRPHSGHPLPVFLHAFGGNGVRGAYPSSAATRQVGEGTLHIPGLCRLARDLRLAPHRADDRWRSCR